MTPVYRWDHRELNEGAKIPAGGFGQTLFRLGPYHGVWARELTLEYVRATEFCHRPSRLAGLFAYASVDHAQVNLAAIRNLGRQHLYEVEPQGAVFLVAESAPGPVENALARQDHDAAQEAARQYWHDADPAGLIEV